MDLDAYQEQAGSTAIYPERGTGSPLALAYVALGLGEAGEVQGKVKKILRDDRGLLLPGRRETLIEELGDVLWYVAAMATELQVPLSEVAERNLSKLSSRAERGALTGSGDHR